MRLHELRVLNASRLNKLRVLKTRSVFSALLDLMVTLWYGRWLLSFLMMLRALFVRGLQMDLMRQPSLEPLRSPPQLPEPLRSPLLRQPLEQEDREIQIWVHGLLTHNRMSPPPRK
jgi:hypothetical protein